MAQVDNYTFQRIVVDGQEEHSDVILLPSHTVSHWRRRHGPEPDPKHTAAALFLTC
jgi:hypothetical protein